MRGDEPSIQYVLTTM